MTGCIMIMCGLPASGKTTLAEAICEVMTSNYSCFVVCYDKLIPSELEENIILEAQVNGVSTWKKYRDKVLLCVDYLASLLLSGTKHDDASKVYDIADMAPNHLELSTWRHFTQCLSLKYPVGDTPFIIIIDDNMYYRSMRYHFHQIAKKHNLGFCEVYMDCPCSVAIERNLRRGSARVKESVINRMATVMEIPDSILQWEQYSLILKPEESDEEMSEKVVGLIHTAMGDPVVAPVDDEVTKEESRRICSANVVHQVDHIVRKQTATKMKHANAQGKANRILKEMSRKMSDVKSSILNDLKSGLLLVPADIECFVNDEDSDFYKFVQTVFHSRLPEDETEATI